MSTTAPLFGKFHSPLGDAAQPLRRRPLPHLESLPADRLDPACLAPNSDQANRRQRDYTPKLTFMAFLDQALNPDSSCREAVRQIRACYPKQPDPKPRDKDTRAYCPARARWTLDEFIEIRRHLADRTPRNPWKLGRPTPPPIKVVDGSCLNLPDTRKTAKLTPNPKTSSPNAASPCCVW